MSQKALKIRENYHIYEIFFVYLHRETIKQGTMTEATIKYLRKAANEAMLRCEDIADSIVEMFVAVQEAYYKTDWRTHLIKKED